jgi:hypothetical protein
MNSIKSQATINFVLVISANLSGGENDSEFYSCSYIGDNRSAILKLHMWYLKKNMQVLLKQFCNTFLICKKSSSYIQERFPNKSIGKINPLKQSGCYRYHLI